MIINEESKIWLFDYDLTLYGEEERHVLDSLDHRITLFVKRTTGVYLEQASEIRKKYWVDYGTTLAGLHAEYQVDPNDFFDFIHLNDGLIFPKKAPQKRILLESIKGKKYVFTNARKDWSDAGLSSMDIADCFDGVMDLKKLDWKGKPSVDAYDKMEAFLKKASINSFDENPSQIIFLEDSIRNLQEAHERGWTTIFVNATQQKPDWVDYQLDHLQSLKLLLEDPHV
ncbi:MAG TPA: pyrimidine 5'-nucleotidase [Fibrobacteraceae bacterium]|nr:pyrimidine 5'-nucleotidase [Fibrobacteraceae bacterium]